MFVPIEGHVCDGRGSNFQSLCMVLLYMFQQSSFQRQQPKKKKKKREKGHITTHLEIYINKDEVNVRMERHNVTGLTLVAHAYAVPLTWLLLISAILA